MIRSLSPNALIHSLLPLIAFVALLTGCGPSPAPDAQTTTPSQPNEPVVIEAWIPSGQSWERDVMREFIHEFNSSQDEILVQLGIIPEEHYLTVLDQAGRENDLPDLIQFDSGYLARYVGRDMLVPLDDLLAPEVVADLLPSITRQGTYQDSRYAVALFDTSLFLYGNPLKMREVAMRLPRGPYDAWQADEFDELLAALHASHGGQPVLDLRLNHPTDWFSFAFGPMLASAGAGFVDPENGGRATGHVNSPEAVQMLTRVQEWFARGYIDPNEDGRAFSSGRVALSLSGPWDYRQFDVDLDGTAMIIPLPDFGHGARTAHGSWTWGITSQSRHPEAAARFLTFILQPDNILQLTEKSGAVPARFAAIDRSSHFGEGAPLHLVVRQLREQAIPRPQTPAYPVLVEGFYQAFQRIREGADVQTELDLLAEAIDSELASFPPREGPLGPME